MAIQNNSKLDDSLLSQLEPISTLSPGRIRELAGLCFLEKVSKDIDPFRMNITQAPQAMYVLRGDLGLRYRDGRRKIIRGGTEAARQPVEHDPAALLDALALRDLQILRIDLDLLDIMMTWDQLAGYESGEQSQQDNEWMKDTKVFSADKLQSGVFSRLPPANINEIFRRMQHIPVKAGQIIITQGAEGDYYYFIESGAASVTRLGNPGEPPDLLATLKEGDVFGEEALVSDNKRNATITMQTDGVLLRLGKKDFVELLKEPLLKQVSMTEAQARVASGAVWLDVRFPSEYHYDHLPGAINVPLNQVRVLLEKLDKEKEYIAYCQTGRRSAAAAFILAQHGLNVWLLRGGTRGSYAGSPSP